MLALGSIGLFAGAVLGGPWLLLPGLVLFSAGDLLLYRGVDQPAAGWLADRHLGSAQRAILREGLTLAGWAHLTHAPAAAVLLAVAAVVVVHGGHVVFRVLTQRARRLRRRRIIWMNLAVDGATAGPRPAPSAVPTLGPLSGPRVALSADVPLLLGLALAAGTGDTATVVAGAVVTILAAALVVLSAARATLHEVRLPAPEADNARLRAALEALAPEVAVYFSGPPTTTYQLNVWLETIDRIDRPTLVIIREKHHLEDLLPTRTPVVVLPRPQDVEEFHLPSLRVALYPTTVVRNNHMIRLPGIRHVFINHGDGDKAVTYSPLHRVFDEIWVAGQAGVDRYLTRGEGVRPDQLVIVGRPQLAHVTLGSPRGPDDPVTVLYAPTWEGNFDDVDYSSVATMGVRLVRTLLHTTAPGAGPVPGRRPVRLLFKPHPATGSRVPAARAALTEIEHLIRQAGAPHMVVAPGPQSLYDAFNEADVLVSDVSSVVADFLASRKPYLVTNPGGLPAQAFQSEFPSATGGGIVAPDAGNLADLLEDALGPDSLRDRRHALATYFLGEPVADPIQRFVDEVDRACAQSQPVAAEGRRS